METGTRGSRYSGVALSTASWAFSWKTASSSSDESARARGSMALGCVGCRRPETAHACVSLRELLIMAALDAYCQRSWRRR